MGGKGGTGGGVKAYLFVGRLFGERLWLGRRVRLRRWRFVGGWGRWIGGLGSWVGGHGDGEGGGS